MLKRKFILVAPLPIDVETQNPGGQLTAAIGLKEYANQQGWEVDNLNTIQPSFPAPNICNKVVMGLVRIFNLVWLLLWTRYTGAILFAGPNTLSLLERLCEALMCRMRGFPVILLYRGGPEYLSKGVLAYKPLAQVLFRIPSYWGVQSSKAVAALAGMGIEDGHAVQLRNWLPSGYTICREPKVIPPDMCIRFIFIGWLIVEKGIQELLMATNNLKSDYRFSVKIIGGGDRLDWVRDFVSSNALEDRVRLLGWQQSEQVQAELLDSHIFVLPSYSEGFPNSLLEAMACGLPGIVSDVGGVSDTLNSQINGTLIRPQNVLDLQKAMERYLNDFSLIEIHSKGALDSIHKFHSYKNTVGKCFNLIL